MRTGNASAGFSLVEMALVLLIVGLLAKNAIGPLEALQEHGKRQQAERELQQVKEAVIAHLVAYGALPCPLKTDVSGSLNESYTSVRMRPDTPSDICRVSDGFVNARGLRIAGSLNDRGALLDPWGREYHYVVSLYSVEGIGSPERPDWTTPGEASAVGVGNLTSDIVLCNALARFDCTGRSVRSDQIAFVIFSTANDHSALGLQAENLDKDNYFVSTTESIVPGEQYDDLIVWGSAADVSYWMLRMGWLP